jgi:hypothetical protein
MFDTTGDKPDSERDLVSGQENNDYSIKIEYRTTAIHWLLVLVELALLKYYNPLAVISVQDYVLHFVFIDAVFTYHTESKLNVSPILIYKYMYSFNE